MFRVSLRTVGEEYSGVGRQVTLWILKCSDLFRIPNSRERVSLQRLPRCTVNSVALIRFYVVMQPKIQMCSNPYLVFNPTIFRVMTVKVIIQAPIVHIILWHREKISLSCTLLFRNENTDIHQNLQRVIRVSWKWRIPLSFTPGTHTSEWKHECDTLPCRRDGIPHNNLSAINDRRRSEAMFSLARARPHLEAAAGPLYVGSF